MGGDAGGSKEAHELEVPDPPAALPFATGTSDSIGPPGPASAVPRNWPTASAI
ncbi:hypothetical protein [Streptomyces sp. NPDC021020]|uniref:hypothetical protein n=1 Tax=Streptomyces sp. NPDC021020 TaxID=3365109 RepID=UPI0037B6CE9C